MTEAERHHLIARTLAAQGFFVFPVDANKKPPIGFGWRDSSTDQAFMVNAYWGPSGVYEGWAVALDLDRSGLFIVDCDRHPGQPDGVAAYVAMSEGEPAPRHVVRTPQDGRHLYYRQRPDAILSSTAKTKIGIEFKAVGNYVVAPGCVVALGEYSYIELLNLDPIPETLHAALWKSQCERAIPRDIAPADADELTALIEAIPNDNLHYDEWVAVVMALHDATGGGDAGLTLAHTFSKRSGKHDSDNLDYIWRKLKKRGRTVATLRYLAAKSKGIGHNHTLVSDAHRREEWRTLVLDIICAAFPHAVRAVLAGYDDETLQATLDKVPAAQRSRPF